MMSTVQEGNLHLSNWYYIKGGPTAVDLSMELTQGAFFHRQKIATFKAKHKDEAIKLAVDYAQSEFPTRWINRDAAEAIKPIDQGDSDGL